MPTPTLTREILQAALAGFQLDKQRIDAQIAEVQAMLGGSNSPGTNRSVSTETPKKGRRKKFSAAARKRMAEAQRLRWVKIKGQSESVAPEPPTPEAPKAKRKISAAGRKAMSEATKKRWALKKAAEAAAKSAPAKKTASKKAAVKAAVKKAPAKVAKKAVKKAAAKKATAKKTAPAAAPAVAEAAL